MTTDSTREQLAELIGPKYQTVRVGADPVSRVLVRRWLEAFGDGEASSMHIDRAMAEGGPALTAPSAMLSSFTGRSLSEMRASLSGSSALGAQLAELGFVTPGVGICQEYENDIRVGDTLTETSWPEHIGETKETRLGQGYFITYRSDFHNQQGDYLGNQRLTTFAFQPRRESPAEDAEKKVAASSSSPERVPPNLPAWEFSLDRMGIIACTAAMGDFNPGHYDPDLATANGFKDIFTDIYSILGFAYTYTRRHAADEEKIASIDLKLGVPLYPADALRIAGYWGEQTSKGRTLHLSAQCSIGLHFGGSVSLVSS